MPVQHPLSAPRLVGDGTAGHRVRPVPQQHPLRGVEQLLPRIADVYARRHRHVPFATSEQVPTVPSGRVPTSVPEPHSTTTEPHRARQMAESFGADAARYDRARPRYPDALIQRIVTTTMLDVGCGTGFEA